MDILEMALLIFALLLVAFFWAILPNTDRRRRANEFANVKYAHRGLHDDKFPENSVGAFNAAVVNGYGIELDVRLTKDNELVVFHDDSLLRMCGVDKKVSDCSYEELIGYRLMGTDYKIPLLSDVLKLIDGKTELLIEIKESGMDIAVTKAAIPMLREYKGKFAVQSFSPRAINYLAREADEMIRGILVGKGKGISGFVMENLMMNWHAKPDFISVDKNVFNIAVYVNYKICRAPAFAWTVRSEEEEKKTEGIFKTVIFENYIPDAARKDYNRVNGTNALKKKIKE